MNEKYVKPIILFILIAFFVAMAVFVYGNQPAGEPEPTTEPPTLEPPVSPLPPPAAQADELEAQVIIMPGAGQRVFTNTLYNFFTIPNQPITSPVAVILPPSGTLAISFDAYLTNDAGEVVATQHHDIPHGLIQAQEPPTGANPEDDLQWSWSADLRIGTVTETIRAAWVFPDGICTFPPEGGDCIATPHDPIEFVFVDENNELAEYTRLLDFPEPVFTVYLPIILRNQP